MFSVNSSLDEGSNIRVPNLYKKLGISNKIALKPPNPKEVPRIAKRHSRRETMFASELPNIFTSFQMLSKHESRKKSSTCTEEELLGYVGVGLTQQAAQKSRFISNWIQNMKKDKENSDSRSQ
jgi:hypothetical protein